MDGVQSLKSRKSILGWCFLVAAVLSLLADFEASIQFAQRIGIPGWHIPVFVPWALAAVGFAYLARLWYAERLNEPIRQILRAYAAPAVQHLGVVSRAVEEVLRSRDSVGHLARLALEDAVGSIENVMSMTVAALDRPSLLSRLGVREGQRRFVAFLNAYERGVSRVHDGGRAVEFEFAANGNYREWKRFDSELLQSVRHLISQTRFFFISDAVETNIWKDGVRHYLHETEELLSTKPKRASGRFQIRSDTIEISDTYNIQKVEEIGEGTLKISWTGEFLSRDEFLGPDYGVIATQTHNCNIDVIEKTPRYSVIVIRPRGGFPMEFVIDAQGEESASQYMWYSTAGPHFMPRKRSMHP